MANTFRLSIVSPDRTVVDDLVTSLTVPAEGGYMGVLAGHEPYLTELKVGALSFVKSDGVQAKVAISGGFMEVDGRKAIVLADAAELAGEIDPNRARVALQQAKEKMAALPAGDPAIEEYRIAIVRAENRLKMSGEH
jgi:F-type H+-transporting ATPase subunit epsilon